LSAWADSFGGITYPLLSDFWPHGEVAQRYGVLRPEGYSERAIFVIDKRGVVRYVDVHNIDEAPDNEVLFGVLKELASPMARARAEAHEAALAQAEADAAPPDDTAITLYCTPWCPDCRRVRDYFRQNGVAYTEIDITRDRGAAKQVRDWAGGSETTPTLNVRGTIMVGYDRLRLARLLGLSDPLFR
jgi:glutaredoxin